MGAVVVVVVVVVVSVSVVVVSVSVTDVSADPKAVGRVLFCVSSITYGVMCIRSESAVHEHRAEPPITAKAEAMAIFPFVIIISPSFVGVPPLTYTFQL